MRDVTISALHVALRGLEARRRVTATNIANIETPGYLAGRVEFESILGELLADVRAGRSDRARVDGAVPNSGQSLAPTRVNGNNVNLDDETIIAEQTDLAYATLLEGLNAKFRLLRTAIKEGR